MDTIKQYNKYIIDFNSINKGMQILFRFPNDYGISLICNSTSYGSDEDKFEIAIIAFHSKEDDNEDWDLIYSSPITDDVLGHQSKEDVFDIIEQTIKL